MTRAVKPPPWSLRFGGAFVRSITRAPDGRLFLAREDAATVLVGWEGVEAIHVADA